MEHDAVQGTKVHEAHRQNKGELISCGRWPKSPKSELKAAMKRTELAEND
jgi:hypothetical protein